MQFYLFIFILSSFLPQGYAAGNAVPGPLKNVEKEFLKKYWAKWKASHTGRWYVYLITGESSDHQMLVKVVFSIESIVELINLLYSVSLYPFTEMLTKENTHFFHFCYLTYVLLSDTATHSIYCSYFVLETLALTIFYFLFFVLFLLSIFNDYLIIILFNVPVVQCHI